MQSSTINIMEEFAIELAVESALMEFCEFETMPATVAAASAAAAAMSSEVVDDEKLSD